MRVRPPEFHFTLMGSWLPGSPFKSTGTGLAGVEVAFSQEWSDCCHCSPEEEKEETEGAQQCGSKASPLSWNGLPSQDVMPAKLYAFTVQGKEVALAMLCMRKRLETRRWTMKPGWYALHLGVGQATSEISKVILEACPELSDTPCPAGCIVGLVKVVGTVPALSVVHDPFVFPACGGRVNVFTEAIQLQQPVKAKGKLGLWPLSNHCREEVSAQLPRCTHILGDIADLWLAPELQAPTPPLPESPLFKIPRMRSITWPSGYRVCEEKMGFLAKYLGSLPWGCHHAGLLISQGSVTIPDFTYGHPILWAMLAPHLAVMEYSPTSVIVNQGSAAPGWAEHFGLTGFLVVRGSATLKIWNVTEKAAGKQAQHKAEVITKVRGGCSSTKTQPTQKIKKQQSDFQFYSRQRCARNLYSCLGWEVLGYMLAQFQAIISSFL